MSTDLIVAGAAVEGIPVLTRDEARAEADGIKTAVEDLRGRIDRFDQGRGWQALGYESFRAWALAEIPEASLRQVYRQLDAARVDRSLGVSIGHTPESHARELKSVSPAERPAVLRQADERAAAQGRPRQASDITAAAAPAAPAPAAPPAGRQPYGKPGDGKWQPGVAHVAVVGDRTQVYAPASLTRVELLYETETTVRGRKPNGELESYQQAHVYCLPDEASWERVQAAHRALVAAFAAVAAWPGFTQTYEQLRPYNAHNPITPTVIRATNPGHDRERPGWYHEPWRVPQIDRLPIGRHTNRMVEGQGGMLLRQDQVFPCRDDRQWAELAGLLQDAEAAQRALRSLLDRLGLYALTVRDGRYTRELPGPAPTPAPEPAGTAPELLASIEDSAPLNEEDPAGELATLRRKLVAIPPRPQPARRGDHSEVLRELDELRRWADLVERAIGRAGSGLLIEELGGAALGELVSEPALAEEGDGAALTAEIAALVAQAHARALPPEQLLQRRSTLDDELQNYAPWLTDGEYTALASQLTAVYDLARAAAEAPPADPPPAAPPLPQDLAALPPSWPALPDGLRYGRSRNALYHVHIWQPAPLKRAQQRHKTLCGTVQTEPPGELHSDARDLCAHCRREAQRRLEQAKEVG